MRNLRGEALSSSWLTDSLARFERAIEAAYERAPQLAAVVGGVAKALKEGGHIFYLCDAPSAYTSL